MSGRERPRARTRKGLAYGNGNEMEVVQNAPFGLWCRMWFSKLVTARGLTVVRTWSVPFRVW